MSLRFRDATLEDVPQIAALQNAAAGALVAQFGDGPWGGPFSERGVALALRHARLRVGVEAKRIVCCLRLAQKKPWAIDVAHFTPATRALYLTNMAVAVAHQRKGVGRHALDDAKTIVREWPAQSIRLDAWDAPAGAGGFYEACGFISRGAVVYRGTPLRYYEWLIEQDSAPAHDGSLLRAD
ncbi:GNAT family N-acetyltransferase [Gemmatimonas sp. UBA7669]|uniref:GNAT family N-acetyltransferase n=1 Tax=Gemmatimonas sp. UBA7669 TaxID=1946568 RepID=UPI0025B7BC33|nr:GNAT family N-acetyltransferase [Gemmatimonas sp. UBA7669]